MSRDFSSPSTADRPSDAVCAVKAPGKVLLSGEYAVLHGAPAIMLALNCHAHAHIRAIAEPLYHIHAPNLGIQDAKASVGDNRFTWVDVSDKMLQKLQLVTSVMQFFAARGWLRQPLDITLDTRAFYTAAGDKLGLGSSAALTVAFVHALFAQQQRQQPALADVIDIHRAMQGGRGSGADIAASTQGGALAYTWQDDQPRTQAIRWPSDLRWRLLATGRSFSTGKALAHMSAWQQQQPQAFARHMQMLNTQAASVSAAFEAQDVTAIIDSLSIYYQTVDALGRASGVDIVSHSHRQLCELGRQHGVLYKSCGAGGGDVGMALSTSDARLDAFCHRAGAAGYTVLDIHADQQGVTSVNQ